jgi:hypothetical protein
MQTLVWRTRDARKKNSFAFRRRSQTSQECIPDKIKYRQSSPQIRTNNSFNIFVLLREIQQFSGVERVVHRVLISLQVEKYLLEDKKVIHTVRNGDSDRNRGKITTGKDCLQSMTTNLRGNQGGKFASLEALILEEELTKLRKNEN